MKRSLQTLKLFRRIASSYIRGPSLSHKTFLEKRSWLHGIIALNRIVEWHIVTFFILAVIAFLNSLGWGWVFTVQALSGAFWVLYALQLNWCLLDVWSVYPGIHLSSSTICGSVFSLISRFLILIQEGMDGSS
jgi:callose synthase